MAAPKLTPGTLYVLRDRDFRTGEWGKYVKIGVVQNEREVEKRDKEHQTGNPREVCMIHSYETPMVVNLETRLHHTYANLRISGEWFEMDDDFVKNVLCPTIENMITEYEEHVQPFTSRDELKNVASNGTTRAATKQEIELHERYNELKEISDRLGAQAAILKAKLFELIGNNGGAEGIVSLQISTNAESTPLDKKGLFQTHPDLVEPFVHVKMGNPSGKLLIQGTSSLNEVDEELDGKKKVAAKAIKGIEPTQAECTLLSRTDEMMRLHEQYLSLLGPIFSTDLEMDGIKARLAAAIGDFEAIEGVVEWKREAKESTSFDKKGFAEAHPLEYEAFLGHTPESKSVSFMVSMKRSYPI